MKVLSIKNPFAYLIIHGIKDVENRSWKTDYRGKLLIHASGVDMAIFPNDTIDRKTDKELKKFIADNLTLDECYKQGSERLIKYYELYKLCDKTYNDGNYYMKKGRIIGSVDLIDISRDSKSLFAEKGMYHWILDNPVLFEKPIENVKGKLSIWDYQLDV